MIPRRHWLIATLAALLLHLAGFAAWQHGDSGDAIAPGEHGIEIALGLTGDLGEAEADVDPTPPPPPAQEPPPLTEETPPPLPRLEQPTLPVAPVSPPAPRRTAVPPQATAHPPRATVPVARPQQVRRGDGRALDTRRGGHVGAKRSYAALLAAHLNRHKRYPLASRRRREEGVVELRLVVARDGSLLNVEVARSGPPALNAAALRMVDDAKPLPSFPDSLPLPQVRVVVPVSFRLGTR